MSDEYKALFENETWELIRRPYVAHIIRWLWLYHHKFHDDGSLAGYKARLVSNGKSQQVDVDCDDTFSPIVKTTFIHIVLTLTISFSWLIYKLNVKNAFLHENLAKNIYMHQPEFNWRLTSSLRM